VNGRIHLGFEVATGDQVSVPLHHAIVSGVTGLSGKTTAISAMLSRLPEGYKSLVFSTKRGEISFEGAHEVQPFYKATVDWEYVSGVLEAARKEKLKFERSWIIKASRGATTLRDVYQNIVAALEEGKPLRGLDESVWTVLRAYFEKVLPELESQPWASTLGLAQGVNVMHLAHLSEEVQGLVIAASLEEAHRAMSDVVLVIPEAWLYVPQQRGSPVKWAAQHIIRQGRARGVFLWLDSQDVTTVSKDVLKSVDLWVLGRQREVNEVRRILDQIPSTQKPKPSDVMTLGVGQSYVAAEDWCKKVYVQPAWPGEEMARNVAMGKVPVVGPPAPAALIPEAKTLTGQNRTEPEPDRSAFSGDKLSEEEEDPMAIADLRIELANAEARHKEAERQVAHLQEVRQGLEKDLAEHDQLLVKQRRGHYELSKQLEEWRPLVEAYAKFSGALKEFMGPMPVVGQPALDLDTLAEKVAARLGPSRPVVQVVPLEALKHQFQEDAVERLLAQVQALEDRPRQAILWLLSVGRPAKHMEICRRLAFPEGGASFSKFGTGIKAAVALGVLTSDTAGLRVTIREKVAAELEAYTRAPEVIEATYQRLLAELAKRSDRDYSVGF
jgi:hypothetical protein